MSLENVIAFWQKVTEDKTLQEKIDPRNGQVPRLHASVKPNELDRLSSIAKEAGYDCSAEELAASEAVMRFWQDVGRNQQLQGRLKPAQSIASEEKAAAEIARIASESGYRFSGEQLNKVTGLLQNTGWMGEKQLSDKQLDSVTGGGYSTSLNLALNGSLTTSIRPLIGPGGVCEYM